MKKSKRHFSPKERCLIEAWLHEGKSIRAMARELSRDRTTVEREIRNRAVESLKGTQWTPNQCARRADCAQLNREARARAYRRVLKAAGPAAQSSFVAAL